MYNLALFLHVLSAIIIGYVILYGVFTRVIQLPSKQLRTNMILLPCMSVIALITGNLAIIEAGYSQSDLWIILTYPLFICLILINEVFLRRKQRKARKQRAEEINVGMEYGIMTLLMVGLTFLMIYKPS